MILTDEQQHQLEDLQEKVALKDSRSWQLFRADHIEKAIEDVNHALLTRKQPDYNAYLALWERKFALTALLNTLDASLPAQLKTLTDFSEAEPDNRPATGELA